MKAILQRAIVIKEHKGGVFRCHLEDTPAHEIIAHPSGRMRKSRITLVAGDHVSVELSPYDLTRGRITWRHQVV